ncbi:MAG: signal peptide peptidase SppA [Bacteroidales bacterium]|nr:signal peptide peptidase SppA [Bacteroidales bacterium]
MKDFIKMTLATIAGLFLFGFVALFMMIAMVGAVSSFGESSPVMPEKGVLTLDMSSIVLAEQSQEETPFAFLSDDISAAPVGIYSAIKAINKAAEDPSVKFIYMKPDAVTGGFAGIEELRSALKDFRTSGKAIVSYMENPTTTGYYLASVSDKIYMTDNIGGMNMFFGLSSQMFFLKDALDRLGINIQLIRHGKYKSAGETFVRNSSSKENMEQNEAMIDSMWESLAGEIAEARGISVSQLNSMLDNLELVLPEDFLEKGLVDELLSRNELEQKLCDLFVAEDIEDVKSISLSDYIKVRSQTDFNAGNKVAVIYANGDIVDGKGKQNVAGERFADIISDVRKDTTVKAVVLRVNSPGGSVMASELIQKELAMLRESVPVIASYGDYAASGGYWISAGCDKIYANATTLTGSIGVFSMIPDFSHTIKDKLHVNITPVNSNRHADMMSLMRPLDPKETAYMQASVEKVYETFTELVAQGRDMTVQEVDAIAQGRVWTGAEALGIGLVDEIGGIQDAIEYAAMSIEGVESIDDVQIAEYPKPLSSIELFMESFGAEASIAGIDIDNINKSFGKAYARLPYIIDIK